MQVYQARSMTSKYARVTYGFDDRPVCLAYGTSVWLVFVWLWCCGDYCGVIGQGKMFSGVAFGTGLLAVDPGGEKLAVGLGFELRYGVVRLLLFGQTWDGVIGWGEIGGLVFGVGSLSMGSLQYIGSDDLQESPPTSRNLGPSITQSENNGHHGIIKNSPHNHLTWSTQCPQQKSQENFAKHLQEQLSDLPE
ncbi:hypothetical protein WN48_00163 [Eufriesea mexicana]|nr:hypothetical protein WN48_00163 [Eufriesea mexicana]